MRSATTKLAALGAVAALGFAGAACASGDDGSTSPGLEEAPAGDTGGDLGTDSGMSEDPMTGGDTSGGLGGTGTTP